MPADPGTPLEPKQKKPLRSRIAALFGSTRQARLISAGTLAALVVAVAAFIALPEDDNAIPRDEYTIAADELCVAEKRAIVAAGERALDGGSEQLAAYSAALVPLVVEWRQALTALSPPADREGPAEDLGFALRQVAVEAGRLARVARTGDRQEVLAGAAEVDAATAEVESAIADLGLTECEGLAISFARREAE